MKKSISEVIRGLQSELEPLITKINALERFIIRRRWTTWAKENGFEVGPGGLD